jgi:transcriptional regulator with XRE-family HTH domain
MMIQIRPVSDTVQYQTLRDQHRHGTLSQGMTAKAGADMNETRPGSPTVLRMILGRQLQALREKAGMSYDQAAQAIYSSPYTVRRMERAEGGLKPLTVKSALVAYGITDAAEVDAFLALARDASKPGWWHSYDDVLPSWFPTFIGLEEAASLIRGYDPHAVPGLLQTPGYAHASVRTGFPDATDEEAGRRVYLRLARQHILTRPDPTRLWLVIDETALRRPVATTGVEIMREQIDKLTEAASQPNITLQVLPLAAGLHPAVYGPFRIFRFDGQEQPDIVYGESMTSAFYIDKPDETALYTQALDRVSAQAAAVKDTARILRQIRKEI